MLQLVNILYTMSGVLCNEKPAIALRILSSHRGVSNDNLWKSTPPPYHSLIALCLRPLDFSPSLPYTIDTLKRGFFMKIPNKTLLVLALGILTFSLFPDLSHESYGKQGSFLTQAPDFDVLAVSGSSLLPIAPPKSPDRVVRTVSVVVTAYSSTTWQTDDTPFTTASGTSVREGVVAANFLPMGTRIKLPDLYGDKIFVVEDRMHPRQKYMVDIWFPSYSEALNFGAKRTYIEVVGG